MPRTLAQLRDDALAIWQAGLEGVRSERLVRGQCRVAGTTLFIGDDEISLDEIDRIAVVGGGKAGAGMAAAIEELLGPDLLAAKHVHGWLNVPADCVRPLKRITLHPARPAGINEPTAAGVLGSEKILEIVGKLGPRDLCLVLISGGGSALLPAPTTGITLADKLAVTRRLSAAGANIAELNTVRKHLSRIKGGGLARACRAGRLVTLVISDVLGDPLELIASGPTVAGRSTPAEALAILTKYDAAAAGIRREVFAALEERSAGFAIQNASDPPHPRAIEIILGNNAAAVDCAGIEAERRSYSHAMLAATELEGDVEPIGRHLAQMARHMLSHKGPDCLIMGGEGTVRLAPPELRGRGGRNQQTVLAALCELWQEDENDAERRATLDDALGAWVILCGGTDGEDGPTDAAGAWIDSESIAAARAAGLDPFAALAANSGYDFFAKLGTLLKTGPTHTNVCDLRVAVVGRG